MAAFHIASNERHRNRQQEACSQNFVANMWGLEAKSACLSVMALVYRRQQGVKIDMLWGVCIALFTGRVLHRGTCHLGFNSNQAHQQSCPPRLRSLARCCPCLPGCRRQQTRSWLLSAGAPSTASRALGHARLEGTGQMSLGWTV